MRTLSRVVIGSLALVAFSKAHAVIIFSDVVVTGSLSPGASFNTTNSDIDFFLPNAIVGDPVDPRRTGDIAITYRAHTSDGAAMDRMTISLLGALSGSGKIFFNEVIEDVASGDILGTASALLDHPSDMPYTAYINFRHSSDIRVKKTFLLSALDTRDYDVAALTLVEQHLRAVPEPATIAAIGLGLAGLLRRRRK